MIWRWCYYYYYYYKCTYLSDTVMRNAAGALYTVNNVPAYKIVGNSEMATSGPENPSNKEMFSVLVGRWWAMMQPIWLTADCSMPVEWQQLIAWQAGQSELLWLTSAGDGGPRRQLPGRYCPRGRTELCHWDSGTSEHRGGTVSGLGRATSGDRAGAAWCIQNASLRRQVLSMDMV